MSNVNPYLPTPAKIIDIIQETHSDSQDVKTYTLQLSTPIDYMPGQFVEVTITGAGEAPFGFASSPHIKENMQLCIKRAGYVTDAFHMLQVGDTIWIRGPYGNTFNLEQMKGHDLFYVAGGLGLAPLRPMIDYIFQPDVRPDYGKINMLVAARSTNDFVFKYDYNNWGSMPDTDIYLTIDNPEPGWDGLVGYPNNLIGDIQFDVNNTYALLCGPPVMIKVLSEAFVNMGLPKERIITSLEMRMTCGVGKCGKCNIGRRYVCIDGPVFSMAEIEGMPSEY